MGREVVRKPVMRMKTIHLYSAVAYWMLDDSLDSAVFVVAERRTSVSQATETEHTILDFHPMECNG